MGLSLFLDVRAWAGYSIRALVISALAIVAVASLVTRGHRWIWTEWGSFAVAFVLGCCWGYDEFVARPAFDRTARVVALGTWLIVIASLAGILIAAWAAFRQRPRFASIISLQSAFTPRRANNWMRRSNPTAARPPERSG
jgi:hypothetical protein